ncbi:MAG TPA: glycosyltransferase family 39 protein [Anaerolineaceae bacterium]|nr:glycosyltransferase family 39 protein [Anaerolineaceae bacterium]
MRITFPQLWTSKTIPSNRSLQISRTSALKLAALAAIVALAAGLRFANLSALGYINHYYSAAIVSMLQSWHNFFFVAAEPGGSVSIDKPPVGLWIQAISAMIFGVNTFGLLLPEILAGILSVILVYHLVQRSFGATAGLLAALALAITPVVVATDRNNTMDSTLILTLLLAAWAFIKATETSKLRYLLLGAALIGVGFNIKMLEAFLPLPAFYALYFLGSAERIWPKLGKLALATGLLLVISLSWAFIVDSTPASQRPYVGSSGDNSVLSLITGYNGIDRLLGMGGGRGGFGGGPFGIGAPPNRRFGQPGQRGSGGFPPFGPNGQGVFRNVPSQPATSGGLLGSLAGTISRAFNSNTGRGFSGGAGGVGFSGPLRLFIPPLSNEVSWLLPFALFSAIFVLFRERLHWPVGQKHQAVVLWGVWLLTDVIFFSIANFFHEYYMSMLAGPLVALVGIGVVELWRLRTKLPWLATLLMAIAVGSTLLLQYHTASAYLKTIWWQPIVLVLTAIGAALIIVTAIFKWRRLAVTGFTCIMAATLVTPSIWSVLTTLNPSSNQSLPAAYDGQTSDPPNQGDLQINQTLLDYLDENTQGVTYLMAVPSSMQGSDYVLATGRPVLFVGGFMGIDNVVNSDQLAQLVSKGELRYVYWDTRNEGRAGGIGGGTQSNISSWVTSNCSIVNNFDTSTQNSGAPDGTGNRLNNGSFFGRGGMQISLYDCWEQPQK